MWDFWTRTSGTWINVMTVVLGTGLGLLLRDRLSPRLQQILTQGVGLLTLWLGLQMASQLPQGTVGGIDGVVLGLLAMVLGGLGGEAMRLEDRLTQVGNWLRQRVRGQGRFTEGFVAASLLFCIGPMTLLGSLTNGLTGDNTLLVIKATMDGIVAVVFAGTYGIGVGFASLTVLFYQGALSLVAGTLTTVVPDPATHPAIGLTTGVGGLMILGIGLNLLEITQIRVGSFLPAIAIAPLLHASLSQFLTTGS